MGTASVKCCEKAKGLMWTPGMLGEDSLPLHLPHRLPFTRWLPHLPSVKLAQVLKKQARKKKKKETSQENQLRPRSWKDLLVASGCRPFMLEHDKLPADFYLQEEKGAMKATEGLEQRDSTT